MNGRATQQVQTHRHTTYHVESISSVQGFPLSQPLSTAIPFVGDCSEDGSANTLPATEGGQYHDLVQ